jgi:hypothetical protein
VPSIQSNKQTIQGSTINRELHPSFFRLSINQSWINMSHRRSSRSKLCRRRTNEVTRKRKFKIFDLNDQTKDIRRLVEKKNNNNNNSGQVSDPIDRKECVRARRDPISKTDCFTPHSSSAKKKETAKVSSLPILQPKTR